jgi:hypothetical protein
MINNYNPSGSCKVTQLDTQVGNVIGSPPTISEKSTKMSWLFMLLFCFLLLGNSISAQTTLISPSGDGGFENGATFALNGWTAVNSSVDSWIVGNTPTPSAGSNCAFISSAPPAWTYSQISTIQHLYKDVTIPAGETKIALTFKWKVGGEGSGANDWDNMKLFWNTAAIIGTPTANSALSAANQVSGAGATSGVYKLSSASFNSETIVLSGVSGTTYRLVFSWKSDSSTIANPPASIDEVNLISSAPIPLSGTYTIDNTLANDPIGIKNFTSFINAVNYLNGDGISGPVVFNVAAGQTFPGNIPAMTATGTTGNTITFQKSGAGANPVITPTGTAGAADAGFTLSGSKYVTIDGINIDATASSGAVEYGFLVRNSSATNGAQFNVVKNTAINLGSRASSNTSYGIFQTASTTGGGVTPTVATGANSNNKYYNLTITGIRNDGVFLNGNASFRDLNTEVGTTTCSLRNSISNLGPTVSTFSGLSGINATNQENSKIFNNDISLIAGNQSATQGIYDTTNYGSSEIFNNKVSGISVFGSATTSSVAYGLRLDNSTVASAHNLRVYNNAVSNINTSRATTANTTRYMFGIFISAGAALSSFDIDNNSVSIGASIDARNSNSCFEIGSATPIYRVRNNVFANFSLANTTARHFCARFTNAIWGATGSVLNNNNYYVANDSGTSGFISQVNTANNTTLVNHIAALTTPGSQDAASLSVNPVFNNNDNDLATSVASLNSAATNLAWVTTDITCAARPNGGANNDIGAYEFNGACPTPTVASVTSLLDVSATINWNATSPVPATGYQYEVRTTGAPGTAGAFTTGSTATTTANITGLTPATLYKFYVRADCSSGSFSSWSGAGSFTTQNLFCTGTPNAGTVTQASLSGCATGTLAPLTLTGSSTGVGGLTYQWEQSTDNASWSNVVGGTGATTASFTPSTATAGLMYYRAVVTCSVGGASATTSNSCAVTLVNCNFDVAKSAATYNSIAATGISISSWRAALSTDDNMSNAIPVGFAFNYKGGSYSNVLMSTNGFLTFNTSTSATGGALSAPYSFGNADLTNSTTQSPLTLAPFYEDLVCPGNPGTLAGLQSAMKYQTDGTAPNRVFTAEWIGMETFGNAGPNLNYQVKLYETTGIVEFVYGTMELFNGTTNYTYTYSVGLNGATVSAVPLSTELTTQQVANTQNFSAIASNALKSFVDCNAKYTFTPGNYSGSIAATALSNDEPATATSVSVNLTPCTNFCGTNFDTTGATASATIPVCTATTPGTPDDDVWFKFVATSAATKVQAFGGGGYDIALQLFSDAGTTSLACANATLTGLTETIDSSALTIGNTYYVRVYHVAAGNGSTANISICVSEIPPPPSNDDPCGAITLTPSLNCSPYSDNALSSTSSVLLATTTTSNGVVTPTCTSALATVKDVWFKYTATSDKHGFTVAPVAGFDVAVEIYTANTGTTCPTTLALTSLGCANFVSTGGVEQLILSPIAGTEYYLRVYRHPSGIAGAPVNNSQFSICVFNPTPPCTTNTVPANAVAAVSSLPTLTWNTANYAASYDVYLGTTNPPTTLLQANVPNTATTTSYTLTAGQQLNELTTYYWYVTPKNGNGSAAGCGATNTTSFVTAAIPVVVTSFTPTESCDNGSTLDRTVIITGSGFTGTTGVTFNGVAAQSFVVNTASQITAVIAASGATGNIVVTKVSGFGTSLTTYVVKTAPVVPAISGGTVVCADATLSLSNIVNGGTWNSSDTSIASIDVNGLVTPNTTGLTGTTTITYSVTNAGCTTAVTTVVTVNQPVVITSSTATLTVTTGDNASFLVAATGTGLSYQWQVDINDLNGFINIPGANSSTLALTSIPASFDGYQYQCVVSGAGTCLPVISNSATLNVGNIGITINPVDQNLCDSGAGTASFSVTTSGETPTFVWQEDKGGSNWLPITNGTFVGVTYSGATSASLSLSGLTFGNSGYKYRCLVTGNILTVPSDPATLTVNQSPVFTASPSNATVCYTGGTATLTATTVAAPVGYSWEYSTDNFATAGTPVVNGTPVGATYTGSASASLVVTTTSLTPAAGLYYYRVTAAANTPCANVSSASAQLIIDTPAITTQPSAASVFAGSTTTMTVVTSASAPTYQWKRAATVGGVYTNVVNGTPANVTYTGDTSGTLNIATTPIVSAITSNFYKCVVTNNGNCDVLSDAGQLSITTYCQPTATAGGATDGVTNVVLTNVTTALNVTQPSSAVAPWFVLYNNTPLVIGQLQTLRVATTFGSDGTQHSAIWIDYNKDGVFSASENVAISTVASGASSTVTYNIPIPLTATPGVTRVRVRGGSDSVYTAAGACTNSTYGETEDYFINITAAPVCSGAPVAGTASASVNSICVSGTTNLTLTGYSSGLVGLSLQWYNSAGLISGATNDTFTTPTLTASETYYCRITCSSDSSFSDSNSLIIGINNPLVDSTTSGTRCGTGTTVLGATGSAGTTLNWFANSTGGAPLGSGTSFTTPSISATTNYFVESSIGAVSENTGRTTPASATGFLFNGYGVVLNATKSLDLVSSVIYPVGTGTVTVALYNNAGTELATTAAINVTGTGLTTPVTLPLNFVVPVGTGYRLLVKASTGITDLLRDFTNTFPYASANASVSNGWNGAVSTSYYYFYNLNVVTGCKSARTAVTATVTPAPVLTISAPTSTLCNGQTSGLVTVTAGSGDYDTFVWTPNTGVSGSAASGYTFNPSITTTYTLNASQSAGLCANAVTHVVTVNALPDAFVVTPVSSALCTTSAPVLLTASSVIVTPIGGCLTGSSGLYITYTGTPTCDGVSSVTTTTLGYGGEYDTLLASANTKYVFSSSNATDYITISDDSNSTIIAAGLTPLTWVSSGAAQQINFWTYSDANCGESTVSRTRSFKCSPVTLPVWTPAAGLFTNAAGTTAYVAGTPSASVYAKPTSTQAYTATATNAATCSRTATTTVNVTIASTWYADADGDGFGNAAVATVLACAQPVGYVANSADCDDTLPGVNPSQTVKTQLRAYQCGTTLGAIGYSIYADVVSGATGYRFIVKNMTTLATQTIDKPVHVFALTQLPSYDYGTAYSINVLVKKSNNVWLGDCSTATCIINTPLLTSPTGGSQLSGSSCGATLANVGSTIYANTVANATGYQFRVTNNVTNATEVFTRTLHWFTLASLTTGGQYGTSYTVEVAVKTTGLFGAYGNSCTVTTPPAPALLAGSCGGVATNRSTAFYCPNFNGVSVYRFQLYNPITFVTQTIDRPANWFNFSQFPGFALNTVYEVRISVKSGTAFSPLGAMCTVTSPIAVARGEFAETDETITVDQDFKVIALPNPFTSNFGLDMKSFNESNVNIQIYDMIGKLLESRDVQYNDVYNQSIGERYPSGVYNVIVSQGENVKTLRVIKQ